MLIVFGVSFFNFLKMNLMGNVLFRANAYRWFKGFTLITILFLAANIGLAIYTKYCLVLAVSIFLLLVEAVLIKLFFNNIYSFLNELNYKTIVKNSEE
jgi:hypothetical protein